MIAVVISRFSVVLSVFVLLASFTQSYTYKGSSRLKTLKRQHRHLPHLLYSHDKPLSFSQLSSDSNTNSNSNKDFAKPSFASTVTSTTIDGNTFTGTNTYDNIKKQQQQQQKPPVLLARVISKIIGYIVRLRTEFVTGLKINVLSRSNRDLLRGRVDKLEMTFDKIGYNQLYVSGGGRLIIEGLELRMRRFLWGVGTSLLSLKKSYRIYGDFLLTQKDIIDSAIIKNLFQLLINTIFGRVFSYTPDLITADITQVSIRNRRVYANGYTSVTNIPASTVAFEVSFGCGVRKEGQVLYLRDIQVVLNPNSILRADIPLLLTAPIDVDIGDNCRLENFVIANKSVWVRAVSIITPSVGDASSAASKIALYKYDLSIFLSSILRLSGGIAINLIPQFNL